MKQGYTTKRERRHSHDHRVHEGIAVCLTPSAPSFNTRGSHLFLLAANSLETHSDGGCNPMSRTGKPYPSMATQPATWGRNLGHSVRCASSALAAV